MTSDEPGVGSEHYFRLSLTTCSFATIFPGKGDLPVTVVFLTRHLSLVAVLNGTWRSLVAHLLGVQGVASSNLAVPTKRIQ